jgi:bacterioferritin-associated ferredoxin
MLEITAICKTETCSFLDKPSVFRSETVATQCGQCGNMMEVTTKEVTDEPEESAPEVEVVVEEEQTPETEPKTEEVTDGTNEEAE